MTEDDKPKERPTLAKVYAEVKDMQEFIQEEIGQELHNLTARIEALEQYKETRNMIDKAMADQMTTIEKDIGEVAGAMKDLISEMMKGGEETEAPEQRTIYADLEAPEPQDDPSGYGTLVSACRGLNDILALAGMVRGDLNLSMIQKEQIIRGACNAAGIVCSPQLLQRAGA